MIFCSNCKNYGEVERKNLLLMSGLSKGCKKHDKLITDLDYPNDEHNCEDYDEKELTR